MELNAYQRLADLTAIYPGKGQDLGLYYVGLALGGEAGEISGKISKYIRDGVLDKNALRKEIGDALWHLAQATTELGWFLDDIADENLRKLQDRKERGVLGGSGDNR